MAAETVRLEEVMDQILDLPDEDLAELVRMLIENRAEAYGAGPPDDDLTT